MAGRVFILDCGDEPTAFHERQRNEALARLIAQIKGCRFGGKYDSRDEQEPGRPYFVPHKTFVGIDAAAAMGIRGPDDLYGGVVPEWFIATKAAVHELIRADATHPQRWNNDLAKSIPEYLLPGYTAFTSNDAYEAGIRLLELGTIRAKDVFAAGGKGQIVVRNAAELSHALQKFPVVLELNLEEVTTYSIGLLQLDGITVSYWGTQRTTTDNKGETVYGGSDLHLVRGGLEDGTAIALTREAKRAVRAAKAFDAAALAHYPEIFASRRNYDVAQGRDSRGSVHCGVIDQSWRIGGNSGVEILALRIFKDRPEVRLIDGSSFNVYGSGAVAPSEATVHFRGIDDRGGPMLTYTRIESVR